MKTNRILFIFSFLICFVFASSCTLPAYRIARYDVQILELSNNDLFFLGNEISINSYSYLAGAENLTSQFTFFANSLTLGTVPAEPGSEPAAKQASFRWTPPSAGEYQLQVEAIKNNPSDDRGGVSSAVRICVLDFPLSGIRENIPGTAEAFNVEGYSGPCPFPPPAPTNPADTSFNFTVGTQTSFFALPTDACPDVAHPVIRFTALVDRDPSDQTGLILVYMSWGDSFGDTPIALSPTGVGPAGEKTFTGSWAPPYIEDGIGIIDGVNTITWTASAFGRDGALLGQTSGTIDLRPCTPGAPAGKVDAPTETPIVEVTATNTPSLPSLPFDFTLISNATCRKGPNNQFEIAEYINNGDTVQAYARSANSEWVRVILKNKVNCWTAVKLGTLSSDISQLPIEDILFIPTATVQPQSGGGGGGGSTPVDNDGDGYASDVDCNDNSSKIYPGAPEFPGDFTDNNCDGNDDT